MDSVEGYEAVAEWLALPLVKLAVVATGWALFHHLCAGARFLLIDVHVGVSLLRRHGGRRWRWWR